MALNSSQLLIAGWIDRVERSASARLDACRRPACRAAAAVRAPSHGRGRPHPPRAGVPGEVQEVGRRRIDGATESIPREARQSRALRPLGGSLLTQLEPRGDASEQSADRLEVGVLLPLGGGRGGELDRHRGVQRSRGEMREHRVGELHGDAHPLLALLGRRWGRIRRRRGTRDGNHTCHRGRRAEHGESSDEFSSLLHQGPLVILLSARTILAAAAGAPVVCSPRCLRPNDMATSVEQHPQDIRGAQIQVAATSFLSLFAIVGLALYGLPFFYDFMVRDFGWTRTQVTSGNAISKLVVGPLFGFAAGWFVDKVGPRRLMIVGILMAGIALFGLGSIRTLTGFYIFYLFNALGNVLVFAADRRRSRTLQYVPAVFGG